MRTDILLVSYLRDLPWAEYCLRSIQKFGGGFGGVTLVVPRSDRAAFVTLVDRLKMGSAVNIKDYVPMKGHEFNHHQLMKCYADVLCPEAYHVLHVDSDCIFTEPFTPADYLDHENRPHLPVRKFSPEQPFYRWKADTEAALGRECLYETMARHPAVHYVVIYRALREHIEQLHGIPFCAYVLGLGGNYPNLGFSEFNALGNIVLSGYSVRYNVVDIGSGGAVPPNKLIQGHSWGGIEASRKQFDAILAK